MVLLATPIEKEVMAAAAGNWVALPLGAATPGAGVPLYRLLQLSDTPTRVGDTAGRYPKIDGEECEGGELLVRGTAHVVRDADVGGDAGVRILRAASASAVVRAHASSVLKCGVPVELCTASEAAAAAPGAAPRAPRCCRCRCRFHPLARERGAARRDHGRDGSDCIDGGHGPR
jgi:hypothetical protein